MMLKICSELPDMYIMIAFMGSCLAGARAISHDFLSLRVSVSSVVGALRGCGCLEAAERCHVCELWHQIRSVGAPDLATDGCGVSRWIWDVCRFRSGYRRRVEV